MSLRDVLNDPKRMIGVHEKLALLWLALTLITTAWALFDPDNRYLLAWVIFMSGYALASTHWSAREGAAPSAPEEPS